jgi:hypothetical protein
LEPYHRSFDKGKPVERRGRKAMDLPLRISAAMIARLPKASEDNRFVNLSAFIEKENRNGTQKSNDSNRFKWGISTDGFRFRVFQSDFSLGDGKRKSQFA